MPRYVVIEFDDNAEARRFVEKANGAYEANLSRASRRVIGVWAKPTLTCECGGWTQRKMFAFYRSAKSGWWVHHDCGRPTKNWARRDQWAWLIGRNLLPGNTDKCPEGWGVADDPRRPELITPMPHEPTEQGQQLRRKRLGVTRELHPRRQEAPDWTI